MQEEQKKQTRRTVNLKKLMTTANRKPVKEEDYKVFEYIYKMESGEEITRDEAIKRWAMASVARRRAMAEEFRKSVKEPVREVGMIRRPPRKEAIKIVNLDRQRVIDLLAEVDIEPLRHPIQVPTLQESFAYPDLTSEDVDVLLSILEGVETEVRTSKTPGKYVVLIAEPFPDFTIKNQMTIPSYRFQFSTIPYWEEFLVHFAARLRAGKFSDTVEGIKVYNEMVECATVNYFGNGSLKGMIVRLKAMSDQRVKLMPSYREKFADTRIHMDSKPMDPENDMKVILTMCVKLDLEGLYDLNVTDPMDLYDSEYTACGVQKLAYKIKNSNPGPIWNKAKGPDGSKLKKGDLYIQDFLLANQMLEDLLHMTTVQFWLKWSAMRLFNMFPKGEVYLKKLKETKTRIIASYCAPIMIPATFILSPFLDSLEFNFSTIPVWNRKGGYFGNGTLFAAKLTLFKGASKEYYNFLMETSLKKQEKIFVFADNIYYIVSSGLGDVKQYSIDLVKAESSMEPKFVSQVMKYIVDKTFMSRENTVGTAWMKYATDIFPTVSADGVGLISQQQIPYPSWGSGSQGTFVMNCFKSAFVSYDILKGGSFVNDKDELSENAIQGAAKNLSEITIELVTHIKDFNLKESETWEMDLIGFDLTGFFIDEEIGVVPFFTLNKQRMYKSILFEKDHRDEKGESKVSAVTELALRLIKMRTMFLNGAWAHSPLMDMVFYESNKLLSRIRADMDTEQLEELDMEDLEAWFREMTGDDEGIIDFESYLQLIVKPQLPTIYELVMLQTDDEDLALRAAQYRIDEMPMHFLFPPEIAKELGFEWEYQQVADLSLKELKSAYPYFSLGLTKPVSSARHKGRFYKKGAVIDIGHTDLPVEMRQTREVPVLDVGPPRLPPKENVIVQVEVVQNIIDWFKKLDQKGRKRYRVPIPERYIGMESEIRNESNAARGVVEDLIQAATGLKQSKARAIVDSTPVQFYFFPTYVRGKGMGYLDELDLYEGYLTFGKLINRSKLKDRPDLKFNDYDTVKMTVDNSKKEVQEMLEENKKLTEQRAERTKQQIRTKNLEKKGQTKIDDELRAEEAEKMVKVTKTQNRERVKAEKAEKAEEAEFKRKFEENQKRVEEAEREMKREKMLKMGPKQYKPSEVITAITLKGVGLEAARMKIGKTQEQRNNIDREAEKQKLYIQNTILPENDEVKKRMLANKKADKQMLDDYLRRPDYYENELKGGKTMAIPLDGMFGGKLMFKNYTLGMIKELKRIDDERLANLVIANEP